jgi:septum formation protein
MGVVDRHDRRTRRRAEPAVKAAPLYLASVSPRRRAILRKLGLRFRVVASGYEEGKTGHRAPAALVRAHALEKAAAAARSVRSGTVIGADTIVWSGRKAIGKPRNLADAARTLARLQGRWHVVYTGVALLRVERGRTLRRRVWSETTRVRLRRMTAADIARYFRRVDPLDKAGSYAIQSKFSVVEQVRGSFFNAMGLPAESLIKNLNIIK